MKKTTLLSIILPLSVSAMAISNTATASEKLDHVLERKIGSALNACAHGLRHVEAGKNVAESVSMNDYLKFNSYYQEVAAERSDILDYKGKALGKVVKDVLPKCIKIMDDYATGVGAKDLPVSKNCIRNVDARLKPILPGGAYHKRLSAVWFARKDLESARYRIYRHKDGLESGGATCDANDRFKEAFKEIQTQFEQAEQQVILWEKERGVEFSHVEDSKSIIFKKDGKALTSGQSNKI